MDVHFRVFTDEHGLFMYVCKLKLSNHGLPPTLPPTLHKRAWVGMPQPVCVLHIFLWFLDTSSKSVVWWYTEKQDQLNYKGTCPNFNEFQSLSNAKQNTLIFIAQVLHFTYNADEIYAAVFFVWSILHASMYNNISIYFQFGFVPLFTFFNYFKLYCQKHIKTCQTCISIFLYNHDYEKLQVYKVTIYYRYVWKRRMRN